MAGAEAGDPDEPDWPQWGRDNQEFGDKRPLVSHPSLPESMLTEDGTGEVTESAALEEEKATFGSSQADVRLRIAGRARELIPLYRGTTLTQLSTTITHRYSSLYETSYANRTALFRAAGYGKNRSMKSVLEDLLGDELQFWGEGPQMSVSRRSPTGDGWDVRMWHMELEQIQEEITHYMATGSRSVTLVLRSTSGSWTAMRGRRPTGSPVAASPSSASWATA